VLGLLGLFRLLGFWGIPLLLGFGLLGLCVYRFGLFGDLFRLGVCALLAFSAKFLADGRVKLAVVLFGHSVDGYAVPG